MPRATATKPRPRKQREAWGQVEPLKSGRVRARYTGPDLAVHKALSTFETLMDARAWLVDERRLIESGDWVAPAIRNLIAEASSEVTLSSYALTWLEQRDLKPRTKALYASQLTRTILPDLGAVPLRLFTPALVRNWYASLDVNKPTARAHCYALLRTIFNTAIADDEPLIAANPCRIRAAGTSKRVHKIVPATTAEIELILERIPKRYRVFVLLGVWCAFRYGEIIELRRKDIDLRSGTISVTRAAGKVPDPDNPGHMKWIVGDPKSAAGIRDVAMPRFLVPLVEEHIKEFAHKGKDGLVFPAAESGIWMEHGGFHETWDKARRAAGRPDLRLHDLRHTGAVLAARNGATLAEIMARLGHSTAAAAMRYQHATAERDVLLAAKLNDAFLSGSY